ncbi:hypothetical protein EDD22DRAFT_859466 [Suillus occidentalis]|nr:hypothetical protein EDD22DRAFT_859466 [Suillus occidentalis]
MITVLIHSLGSVRILCASTARPVALQCQIFKLGLSVVLSITGAPRSPNVPKPFSLGGPQFLAYAQDETPSTGLKGGLCREGGSCLLRSYNVGVHSKSDTVLFSRFRSSS